MEVFPAGQIQEIRYLRLDPGELLLETFEDYLKSNNLRDVIVLTAVGSLCRCHFHTVVGNGTHPSKNKFIRLKGSIEIISLTGIVVDFEPHLHICLNKNGKFFGGHLEHGCEVFTMVELSLAVMNPSNYTRLRTPEITGYHYKNLRKKT